MNVYILVQTYSNGVSNNRNTFSSMKKAQKELDYILDTEEKHGWTVSRNYLMTHRGYMVNKIEKGEARNTMMYHIEKHEVM